MTARIVRTLICAAFAVVCVAAFGGPAATLAAAIERAYLAATRTSAGQLVESATSAAVSKAMLEGLARKHGDRVLEAAGDGGIEFLRAASRHGDEFVELSLHASPTARRAFALSADELMPLARQFGGELIEAEAKAPGVGRRLFEVFGKEEGGRLAREVPASDLPRLIRYGEKGVDGAARSALAKAYRNEGATLFERIPPQLVLNAGLSAAMIVGASGSLQVFRAIADFIREHPFMFMLGTVLCAAACLAAWRVTGTFDALVKRHT